MTEFARAVLARRHRNGEIVNAVARKYGIAAKAVPARDHAEAYWLAACLMRRAGNLSLQDVADRFGVSIGRISQIQSKIETRKNSRMVERLLRDYKVDSAEKPH